MTTRKEPGKRLGAGATADIYAYGENQVLKLYRSWVPDDWITHEAKSTEVAHNFGLPVPRIDEVISDGERRGILMERVEGSMMVSLMMSKPWKNSYYGRILAELQVKVNAQQAPEMISFHPRLESNIRHEAIIPEDTKEEVINVLQELPDGGAFCHFDLHPLNVIMSSRGPVLIDWSGAGKSDPMADLARTWLLCTLPPIPNALKPARGILYAWLRNFFSKCLEEYSRLGEVNRERYEAWKVPIIAARLPEEPSNDRKAFLLKVLEKQLKIVRLQ